MSPPSRELDPELKPWAQIRAQGSWSGLLIGNGASRAVWDGFAYDSLYKRSTSPDLAYPLTQADQNLFGILGTQNFESVLMALRTTLLVKRALGEDPQPILERYHHIRLALVETVRAEHVAWDPAMLQTLQSIRDALRAHSFVYSTNYDLLVYWAIMAAGSDPTDFRDFFWNVCAGPQQQEWLCFEPANVDVIGNPTRVFYLHGGLHLYKLPSGESAKRKAETDQNLLEFFAHQPEGNEVDHAIPLFVAEGTAADKRRVIHGSEYLSFAYSQFRRHPGQLVIFGHSLGNSDRHIVEAIQNWTNPTLAISLRSGPAAEIIQKKAYYHQLFPRANMEFFDAATHPLGDAKLRVISHPGGSVSSSSHP